MDWKKEKREGRQSDGDGQDSGKKLNPLKAHILLSHPAFRFKKGNNCQSHEVFFCSAAESAGSLNLRLAFYKPCLQCQCQCFQFPLGEDMR